MLNQPQGMPQPRLRRPSSVYVSDAYQYGVVQHQSLTPPPLCLKITKWIFASIAAFLVLAIIWEHVATNVFESDLGPVSLFNWAQHQLEPIGAALGNCWARISAFLVHLHLDKLAESAVRVISAFADILRVPFLAFKAEFLRVMMSYAPSQQQMIQGGSLILIVGVFPSLTYLVVSNRHKILAAISKAKAKICKNRSA